MRNILNGLGDIARHAGDALSGMLGRAKEKLSGSARGRGRTYAGGRTTAARAGGSTPVLGAPGTPIRSAAAVNSSTSHPGGQTGPGNKKTFGSRYSFRNKKRFGAVVSVATAAILVPIFATSALQGGTFVSHGVSVDVPAALEDPTMQSDQPLSAFAHAAITETAPEPAKVTAAEFNGAADADGSDTAGTGAAPVLLSEDGTAIEPEITASEPDPTETPDPYMSLHPGDTSDEVLELQQRLMDLHYMENDEPTDYYGPQTQQAVAYFQRKHNLTVDGYAGPETQDLLFSDDAKYYTVAEGAEGNDVWSIQERLENLGYPVAVTGYFGTTTTSAVQYFQRMNGLTDDGTVGTETKDLLFSEHAERAIPPEPDPEPAEETSSGSGGSSEESSSGSSSSGSSESSSSGSSSSGSGSSSSSESSESSSGGGGDAPAASSGSVEAFVEAACAQEGKPYVLGGKGPNNFDCSGLVYYALKASGNGIGYMTSGGWAGSGYPSISWDNLRRGDVVCMKGHVAVYLGDGMMCDASSSNGRIMIRSMGNWARNNFICGKRPL